jgi:protein-tyrosine phosphatase
MLRRALERRFGSAAPGVSSAGTIGWEGSPATAESVLAAAERGVDISGHVAHELTDGMIREADLIVCMACEHRDEIDERVPKAAGRTFTLKELTRALETAPVRAPLGPDTLDERIAQAAATRSRGSDDDVFDPLGMSLDTYRSIAQELDEWTERLIVALFGPVPVSAGREGA